MPSPLTAAGAVQEPSEYACLSMDRVITGMWTQRNPLRDADVPYLYGKFYSASRFDSLLDGINREITSRLTLGRRAGTSVWNANNFAPINSFCSWSFIQDAAEKIRVLADCQDGVLYEVTAGVKTSLFTKTAGAGKARFLGVNTQLLFTNGTDLKQVLVGSKAWAANKTFTVGDYIIDTNGNLQSFEAVQQSRTITNVWVKDVTVGFSTQRFAIITFSAAPPPIMPTQNMAFSGLTTYVALNGQSIPYQRIEPGWNLGLAANQIAFAWSGATQANTADTGTMVTNVRTDSSGNALTGTTGGSAPVWATTLRSTTGDGTVLWTCYGSQTKDWGIAAPTQTPSLSPGKGMNYWQPNITVPATTGTFVIIDSNGNYQVNFTGPTATGSQPPNWNATLGGTTKDGSTTWMNIGRPISYWSAGATIVYGQCLVDTNGNLQWASAVVSPGKTGTVVPTWATTQGTTTADNNVTWTCAQAGTQLVSGTEQYAFSFGCIDGSVSTASPVAQVLNGALGSSGLFANDVTVYGSTNPLVNYIYIWRTAQGQPTLVYVDKVPNPGSVGIGFTYHDVIPDTSTTGQQALNAFITAPTASSNNPPLTGMTAPTYHCRRVWAIYQSSVVYSGGPDTATGNGNTAFPPLNSFPFTEQPIRLFSGVTQQGPTLFIFGTKNVWAIFGTGTATDPFTQPIKYLAGLGIQGYDAISVIGSTWYLISTKNKFVSLDPGAGFVELGFPIGDQFNNVTTGAGSATTGALYSPSTAFVTFHEQSSGDTAIYVADGAVGWFRLSPIASPESGQVWSPRAAIIGGTSAVQSVETTPGTTQLLVGPATTGPIRYRDTTVATDYWSGTAQSFPSWATLGNIVLCQSGEVAEIAHIALKCIATGQPPITSLLLGEVSATAQSPFEPLEITSDDPPDLMPSTTMHSKRYSAMQNGVCPKCDNFQMKIDFRAQAFADELLMFSIYGAKHAERKQQ